MESERSSKHERSRRLTMLVCIAASLAFWTSLKFSGSYATNLPVRVDYQLPAGLAFAKPPPKRLDANVRATGWQLLANSLTGNEHRILVDSAVLRASSDGSVPVRRSVDVAFAKTPLTVTGVSPERLRTATSKVATKRLPVRMDAVLRYTDNFSSTRTPRLSPDSVTVTGPQSVLDSLRYWPTDTTTFKGLRDTMQITIKLARSQTTNVRVSDSFVTAQVQSQQFTEKGVYVPLVVVGGSLRDSLEYFPRRVLITCTVGLRDYESVRASGFTAVVDLEGVDLASTSKLPVTITRQPATVRQLSVAPATVQIYRFERELPDDIR